MRRGRGVHDFELEGAGLMKVVELLQRGKGFGAGELGGQTLVERIVENSVTHRGIGDEAFDDSVPGAGDVEHHRRELQMAVESGGGELSRADSRRLPAQVREAERVAQAL